MFPLLRTGVTTKEMRRDVLTRVFAVLIEYAQAKARTAVAACSLVFMADVENSRANNKAVNKVQCSDKAYCQFLNSYLKPYMAQMALASYGGPVAMYVHKSSSLGDVTKLELCQLLTLIVRKCPITVTEQQTLRRSAP